MAELRAKAEFTKVTGLIPTLDACASVIKSDTAVGPDLKKALREAFCDLIKDQQHDPDYHPRTNDMVQDLVHPSLYPLVFGRTKVILDEVVGVEDAISAWAGKGETIPTPTPAGQSESGGYASSHINTSVPKECWSTKYQWLPANVAFTPEGGVRFTSYINNLHPLKHTKIYRTIEKLIEASLPAWDACLPQCASFEPSGPGIQRPRFPYPENAK